MENEQVPPAQDSISQPEPPPVNTENVSSPPKAPKNYKKLIIFIIFFLLFLVLLSFSIFSLLVAYEKIDIKNDNLRLALTNLVFKIPFLPKTPKQVLLSSLTAHSKVTSANVNASLATSSTYVQDFLGLTSFDADFRYDNEVIYFKFNKFPLFLKTLMYSESLDTALLVDQWVMYDNTGLDTEARRELDSNQEPKEDLFDKQYRDFLETILDEEILPKAKLTSEDVDGTGTYKIDLLLTEEMIKSITDRYDEKYSNSKSAYIGYQPKESENPLKEVDLDIWVDKKTSYIKKLTSHFTFEMPKNTMEPSYMPSAINVLGAEESIYGEKFEFVFSLTLNNVGETFEVPIPSDAIDVETYLEKVFKPNPRLNEISGESSKWLASSLVEQIITYKSEKNVYPDSIQKILTDDSGYYDDYYQQFLDTLETNHVYYKYINENSAVVYVDIPDETLPLFPYYVHTFEGDTNLASFLPYEDFQALMTTYGIEDKSLDIPGVRMMEESLSPAEDVPSSSPFSSFVE